MLENAPGSVPLGKSGVEVEPGGRRRLEADEGDDMGGGNYGSKISNRTKFEWTDFSRINLMCFKGEILGGFVARLFQRVAPIIIDSTCVGNWNIMLCKKNTVRVKNHRVNLNEQILVW